MTKAAAPNCDTGHDPLDRGNIPAGASRVHVLTLRLKRLLDADISRTLARHSDLSVPEWRILSVLNRGASGHLTQKDIVREVGIAQGQASRALFALQGAALVEAHQSRTDRRAWNYALTGRGRALFERLLPHLERRRAALEGSITREDLLQFEEIASRIAATAQNRLSAP